MHPCTRNDAICSSSRLPLLLCFYIHHEQMAVNEQGISLQAKYIIKLGTGCAAKAAESLCSGDQSAGNKQTFVVLTENAKRMSLQCIMVSIH